MKVFGLKTDYTLYRDERARTVVCYGKEDVDENNATWHEVYFYKRKDGIPKFKKAKDGIEKDINDQTDEKILNGLVWNDMPVYLSSENQFNFKSAFDRAVQTNGANLPVKFKLGEQDGEPVYHTFTELSELTDFYDAASLHILTCLNEGWARKDGIDWDEYKPFFPVVPENQ